MTRTTSGQVIFRGDPIELMQAAQGHVWMLTTFATQKPNHDLTVVSMLHMAEEAQYRLIGSNMTDYPEAKLTQPDWEDGFVCLIKSSGQTVDVL